MSGGALESLVGTAFQKGMSSSSGDGPSGRGAGRGADAAPGRGPAVGIWGLGPGAAAGPEGGTTGEGLMTGAGRAPTGGLAIPPGGSGLGWPAEAVTVAPGLSGAETGGATGAGASGASSSAWSGSDSWLAGALCARLARPRDGGGADVAVAGRATEAAGVAAGSAGA